MKRFFLFALSCLSLCTAPAQTSVPRPKASGVKFSVNRAVNDPLQRMAVGLPAGRQVLPEGGRGLSDAGQAAPAECQGLFADGRLTRPADRMTRPIGGRGASKNLRSASGLGLRQLRTGGRTLRKRPAPQADRPLTVMVDSTLCTAYTQSWNGSLTRKDSISYDKYGLRRMVSGELYDSTGCVSRNNSYTYDVNEAAFWTRRVIESDYRPAGLEDAPEQDWYVCNTVLREMDPQGRLLSLQVDDPRYAWQLRAKYDYDHVYADANGRPLRGIELEREETLGGELLVKYAYRWHEAAANYLMESYESDSHRETAEFADDSVSTTIFTRDSVRQWQLAAVVTDYYRLHGLSCTGSKSYVPGRGTTGLRETLEDCGDSLVEIGQEYVDSLGGWTNSYKFVWQGQTWSPYYHGEEYSHDGRDWQLVTAVTMELIHRSPKLNLYTYCRYDAYTAPEDRDTVYWAELLVDSLYYSYQQWSRVDDGTFVHTRGDDYSTTFRYYDIDGNLLAAYMLVKGISVPVGDSTLADDYAYIMYVLDENGNWTRSNEFQYSYDGYAVHHRCNDQGYPERIITYLDDPEAPVSEHRFTYTDKGYTETVFKHGMLWASETYELLDDGWLSDILCNYDSLGHVMRAVRRDSKPGGERTYTWDGQSFTLDSIAAHPYVYSDNSDMTVTVTSRVADWDVVPVAMQRVADWNYTNGSRDYREMYYHWNPTDSVWVGDTARMDYRYIFDDVVLDHGRCDLMESYDDGPDGYGTTYTPAENEPLTIEGTIRYAWDPAEQAFRRTEWYGTDVVSRDSNIVYYLYEGDWVGATVYTLDDAGRIVAERYVSISDGGNGQETNTVIYYAYTPQGYLLSREANYLYADVTLVENFTYERRTLTVTGIDELRPDATARLSIEGLTVGAPGRRLSLYDLQGARVATGNGSVTAPRPGLYIIKVGSGSAKVVLR